MKPFILMTIGRTGSTALMDALALHDDIAVPNKQIDCIDNEIFNPEFIQRYVSFYQKFSAKPIKTEIDLINNFFSANQPSAYAGFKSMPERHKQLNAIINTPAIQVITLTRQDIASTIASFIVAIDQQTWRRNGEQQTFSFTFSEAYKPRVLGHLKYILKSQKILKQFPNAIPLVYEDLCKASFNNEALNDFFQRSVQLNNPKQPTCAKHYVDNWDEFCQFIQQQTPLI